MPCWRISSAVVNLDECLNYYMPIIITITWIHCCDSTVWVHCRVPTVYCCHCSHQCSPFTVTVVPVNQPVMCVQGGVRLLVEGDDNPDVCISRPTSISVIVDRRSHVVLSMQREVEVKVEVKVDSPQTNVTVSHRRLFVSMTRWTQPGVQTITESLLKRLILEQLTLPKFHSGRSKRCRDIRIETVGYTYSVCNRYDIYQIME